MHKPPAVRNWLGLALIPQAGVAIGLAALGARTLGGDMGQELQTIILASSVLYELVGPACAKLSLHLSGSYAAQPAPDAAAAPGANAAAAAQSAPAPNAGGAQKPASLQAIIRQVQQIQADLPEHPAASAEEQAFTEAAEEQYALASYQHDRRFRGRLSGGNRP